MPLSLESRFLPPQGWITHSFTNPETGHKIHYGRVYPQGRPPAAVIVCLGGLSEFSEKYYETAHNMLARGYAFWILDWQYQGRWGRLEKAPFRRRSYGFNADISDLKKFVDDYILPAAVNPDVGRVPLVMLAHSMGGNIGLRFLAKHPKKFDAAAFSAPFLGIHKFPAFLKLFVASLTPAMPMIGKKYAPGGSDIFSSDPARDAVHTVWSKGDPALQVGGPTFGWVAQALKSCAALKRKNTLESITIPVLLACAGREAIVDNNSIRAAAKRIPNARLLEIDGARHEILMEADEYRNMFLKAFDKMMEENKIATIDNVKPF